MTLVEFLTARLVDEAAEIAKQPDAEGEFEGIGIWSSGDVLSNTSYLIVNKQRALRDVEAKRRIVGRHRPEYHLRTRDGEYAQDEAPHCPDHLDDRPWPCADVLDVAAVYADHPDYREEWRP